MMESSNREVRGVALWVAGALAVSIGAVACGGGGEAEGCAPPCGVNEMCVNHVCVLSGGADDGGGEDAEDVPETPPADDGGGVDDGRADWSRDAGDYNVGAACSSPADCVGPGEPNCVEAVVIFGYTYSFPNGYCSSTCDPASPATSCGPGGYCLWVRGIWEGCAKTCDPAAVGECREAEGYSCIDPASLPFPLFDVPMCFPI